MNAGRAEQCHRVLNQAVDHQYQNETICTNIDNVVDGVLEDRVKEVRMQGRHRSILQRICSFIQGVYYLTLAGIFQPRKYKLAHRALHIVMNPTRPLSPVPSR